jgi:hypothetical protein
MLKFFTTFTLLLLSTFAFSCDTYTYRAIWSNQTLFFESTANSAAAAYPDFTALWGITCANQTSTAYNNCMGDNYVPVYRSAVCAPPPPEPEDRCNDRKETGGLIWADDNAPEICDGSCLLSKTGSNSLIIGTHQSGTGQQSTYTHTGKSCSDNPDAPLHSSTSEEGETGQGESCTDQGNLVICNVPDTDGDGKPEMPPLEVNEGCMSVTNKATSTSTVVCGDPIEDGSDKTCGFTSSGDYGCYPNNECVFKNGNPICLSEDGDYVGTDSPDHPLNGGNLDSDNTNDILDPNSNITGPALTDNELIKNSNSASQIADDLSPLLSNIDNSIQTNGEKIDGSNVLLNSIASGITDLNQKSSSIDIDESGIPDSPETSNNLLTDSLISDIDGAFTDGSGNPEKGNQFSSGSQEFVSMLGIDLTSNCQDTEYKIYQNFGLVIKCSWANYTNAILTWVFYFYTIFTVFMIAINTKGKV